MQALPFYFYFYFYFCFYFLLYFAKTISAIFHFLYQIVENASSKPVNSCKETQLFLNKKKTNNKGLLLNMLIPKTHKVYWYFKTIQKL